MGLCFSQPSRSVVLSIRLYIYCNALPDLLVRVRIYLSIAKAPKAHGDTQPGLWTMDSELMHP